MVAIESIAGVAIIALGIVLSPGPNMAYLVSRTLAQGRAAGLISLAGVGLGLVCYMLAAAMGMGALFTMVPAAYELLKIAGAAYLAFLAWQILTSDSGGVFGQPASSRYSSAKLFAMGLVTNLLNPKIALLYAALLPQFIEPSRGGTFAQFIALGFVQITVALSINALIVLTAAKFRLALIRNPRAMTWQRWISGTVLGAFALRMLLHKRPAT